MIEDHPVIACLMQLAENMADENLHDKPHNYQKLITTDGATSQSHYLALFANNYVLNYFLDEKPPTAEIEYEVALFSKIKDTFKNEMNFIKTQYDLTKGFIFLLWIDLNNLPSFLVEGLNLSNNYVQLFKYVPFYKKKKPSNISKQQIHKRLTRMLQSDQRLLIIDTVNPDFMGKNLEKWLREIKDLQYQGKHISVMINSEDPKDYLNLPDYLKSEILPIQFKN
jgi:hypothetical protein